MKILSESDDSILWLLEWNESVRQNLQSEAKKRGINPERLIFALITNDRMQILSRYRIADLFLDTMKQDANDVTTEALLAGLPILSLFGHTMANRMTASKLSMLDLHTLICATEEEYCERAYYLATHPEYLEILKRKVQRNVLTKPIFNTQLTVLNLEKAYHQCWERYFLGEMPEAFQVVEE